MPKTEDIDCFVLNLRAHFISIDEYRRHYSRLELDSFSSMRGLAIIFRDPDVAIAWYGWRLVAALEPGIRITEPRLGQSLAVHFQYHFCGHAACGLY